MTIYIIGIAVWLIGAIVAWFQIKHWSKGNELTPEDRQTMIILSLLSWAIYPISALEWLTEYINTK